MKWQTFALGVLFFLSESADARVPRWQSATRLFCKTAIRQIEGALELDPVRRFMFRFRTSPDIMGLEPARYEALLSQLKEASPQELKDIVIRLPKLDRGEFKEMRISPIVMAGWRQLGFVNAEGRFDIDADPRMIIQKFEELSGFKVLLEGNPLGLRKVAEYHYVVGDYPLRSHEDYIRLLVEGVLPVSDIHDFLFHMAQLVDPDYRRFVHLAARFDQMLGTDNAKHSPLNLAFEGGDVIPDFDVLFGPVQLMNTYLSAKASQLYFSSPKEVLTSFAWHGDGRAYRLARDRRRMRDFLYRINLTEDMIRPRTLLLVLMEHEMKYFLGDQTTHKDPELLKEIEAEIRYLSLQRQK